MSDDPIVPPDAPLMRLEHPDRPQSRPTDALHVAWNALQLAADALTDAGDPAARIAAQVHLTDALARFRGAQLDFYTWLTLSIAMLREDAGKADDRATAINARLDEIQAELSELSRIGRTQ